MIQNQDQQNPASPPAVSAQAILGMPEGGRVVIGLAMSKFIFDMVSSSVPAVGSALGAISQQSATVGTANEDLVRIVLDKSVTLPGGGDSPNVTYEAVTVSLVRTVEGLFDFGITATTSAPGAAPLSYSENGLTAWQDGENYVLSAGSEPHLRVHPASDPNATALIESYTAPYLKGQSGFVRALAPTTTGLISLTRLPDTPSGSSDQQIAAQKGSSG